jgi:hypothetical protein
MFNLFFLAMYNASEIKGDLFTIGILFSISEGLGILCGEFILSLVEIHQGFIFANIMIVITSILVKWPGIP